MLQFILQRPTTTATMISQLKDENEVNGYQDEDVEDFDNEINNNQTETIKPLRKRHWTSSNAQAGALFGPNLLRL